MAEERTIKSINKHDVMPEDGRDLNVLVQPTTGGGSGQGAYEDEQYRMNLSEKLGGYVEFTDIVNNLSATEPGKVADARQLKVLKDAIDSLVAGLVWKAVVQGFATSPPESPADGEAWIVGTPSSGAFVDRDGNIAVWSAASSEWAFLQPKDNWAVFDEPTFGIYTYYAGQWSEVANFSALKIILQETRDARDDLLGDEGFIVVAADLTGDNDIGTVATGIEDVIQVAAVHADVSTVAGIHLDVAAVSEISMDVTKVAGMNGDVPTVAGLDTEIAALGARTTEIDALYAELGDIGSKVNKSDYPFEIIDDMVYMVYTEEE